MKMSDAFKRIEKPEEVGREELEAYLKQLYQEPNYEIKNAVYKEETAESVADNIFAEKVEDGYKRRAKLLIDELVRVSGNPKFHGLEKHFGLVPPVINVFPGESRHIVDAMREIVETICYKYEHNLIANPDKFNAQIKSATINDCTPGALTNMQNILYSTSDSLYPQKYQYISNFATEYARENLTYSLGMEVHKVNELIHEVSREYNVIPPKDIYARYRDLNAASTDAQIAQFKNRLNEHFESRNGVHNFVSYVAGDYAAKLPDVPESKVFASKDENNNNSTEFEMISNIAADLGVKLDDLIAYEIEDAGEENYEYFKYKDGYLEAIELGVMWKLKNEDAINYQNLEFQEQVVLWNGKNVEKTFEIIEAPSAWYKINNQDHTVEKCLDTKGLKNLTVNGQNIEDYLHEQLKDKGHIGFDNAITVVLEENEIPTNSDDMPKKLFLLSDQYKKISQYFDPKEEFLTISDIEFYQWKQLVNEKDKLLYIISYGDEKMLERFINKENISNDTLKNWRNNESETLLHVAAQSNNANIISKLIDLGVDGNVLDKNGHTALHIAVQSQTSLIST